MAEQTTTTPAKADNTRLLELLATYVIPEKPKNKDYRRVMGELVFGNAFFIVPLIPRPGSKVGGRLSLNQIEVHDMQGMKTVGVFTDDSRLPRQLRRAGGFVRTSPQEFINFCASNGIQAIVIDTGKSEKVYGFKVEHASPLLQMADRKGIWAKMMRWFYTR